MNDDDLGPRLRATFIAELEEQVGQLNADLLALEADPADAERLRSVFRSAHSLKGAARVAGISQIERACHALESFFAAVREGTATFGNASFRLLFAAADALADARGRLAANEQLDAAPITTLTPALEKLGRGGAVPDLPVGVERVPGGGPVAVASGPEAETTPAGGRAHVTVARQDVPVDDAVRISAEGLDGLLAAAGDLLAARGRVEQRARDLEALRDNIAHVARDWRRQSRRVRPNLPAARVPATLLRSAETMEEGFSRVMREIERVARESTTDAYAIRRISGELGAHVRGLRLRPFREACAGLPRAARDVAAAANKEVLLELEGQDVEADRTVIGALREPLLQLVRNAIDHGIEPPPLRERAGKARQGTVRVAATLAGGRLCVMVRDDGAGLDADAIRARMREVGRNVGPTREALIRELLSGGISTRRRASAISGRGVGLDVVRDAMQRIRGSVEVSWRTGQGTTFTLDCPPTPTIIRALLVGIDEQALAIPTADIERLLRADGGHVRRAEGRPVLLDDGRPIPLLSLATLLGPPLAVKPLGDSARIVVLAAGERRIAVAVDELLGEDEIVVQPLRRERERYPFLSGGAILPSGRVAIVLSPHAIVDAAVHSEAVPLPVEPVAAAARPGRRVLVVDDSITTRTLEQSVLEAAGYDVVTAVDGMDAWRRLEEAGCDLVVADVEMPRMDGFELCQRIRATQRLRNLPVVLVSALETPEHRARGLEVGADAYVFKSSFEQETLLETIRGLLGEPS